MTALASRGPWRLVVPAPGDLELAESTLRLQVSPCTPPKKPEILPPLQL